MASPVSAASGVDEGESIYPLDELLEKKREKKEKKQKKETTEKKEKTHKKERKNWLRLTRFDAAQ